MKPVMFRLLTLALPLAAVAAASCGQVTGLSDDYQFDLVDGGAADGARDSASADGPLDSALDARDANACTPQATALAFAKLNGTPACKTCLAQACCTDIEVCTKVSECKNLLSCKLDCTTQGDQRAQCQNKCANNGGGAPASYTSGVGACGGAACKQECGLP